MADHGVSEQPDGIDSDSHDLPDPAKAAARVREYLEWWGDGLIDTAGPNPSHGSTSLYARDLQALANYVDEALALGLASIEPVEPKAAEFVLSWHPLIPSSDGMDITDGEPVEIPLGEPWVLPGTDITVGQFHVSTREVPGA